MNEQFKQNILNAIRNNTIVNTSHWGAASYIVYNAQGVKLIEAVCDFDYGAYMLTVGDTVVLSANKNTTHRDTPAEPVVREVGDICRACAEQFEIQEKLKFVKRQMSAQKKNCLHSWHRHHLRQNNLTNTVRTWTIVFKSWTKTRKN